MKVKIELDSAQVVEAISNYVKRTANLEVLTVSVTAIPEDYQGPSAFLAVVACEMPAPITGKAERCLHCDMEGFEKRADGKACAYCDPPGKVQA